MFFPINQVESTLRKLTSEEAATMTVNLPSTPETRKLKPEPVFSNISLLVFVKWPLSSMFCFRV